MTRRSVVCVLLAAGVAAGGGVARFVLGHHHPAMDIAFLVGLAVTTVLLLRALLAALDRWCDDA